MGVLSLAVNLSLLLQSSSSTIKMWLSPNQMNSLLYWENPRDSGIICGSVLVCLLAVRYTSLISVIGNLSLALVTATMSFRIYKSVLAAVNKNQEGHPFKEFLDVNIRIPEAQLTAAVENAGARINGLLAALKAAILVENLVESAKIAVALMPLLTKYEELAGKVSAALPASVTGKKE